jgi:hypothetical protein
MLEPSSRVGPHRQPRRRRRRDHGCRPRAGRAEPHPSARADLGARPADAQDHTGKTTSTGKSRSSMSVATGCRAQHLSTHQSCSSPQKQVCALLVRRHCARARRDCRTRRAAVSGGVSRRLDNASSGSAGSMAAFGAWRRREPPECWRGPLFGDTLGPAGRMTIRSKSGAMSVARSR